MTIAADPSSSRRGLARVLAGCGLAAACWVLLESRADAKEPQGPCRPSGTEWNAGDPRPRCVAHAPPGAPHGVALQSQRHLPNGTPPPAPSIESVEPADHWYGWQTLIADGLSLGLLLGASAASVSESSDPGASPSSTFDDLMTLGFVAYVVAAPTVHGLQGRSVGRVVGSVALRVFVPLLGAFGGAAMTSCTSGGQGLAELDDAYCEAGGAGLGLFVGMLVAIGADAALSFEPSAAPPQAVRIYPSLRATGHSTQLGVAGSF